jgi:hypothetical protein
VAHIFLHKARFIIKEKKRKKKKKKEKKGKNLTKTLNFCIDMLIEHTFFSFFFFYFNNTLE